MEIQFFRGKYRFPDENQLANGISSINLNKVLNICNYNNRLQVESVQDHMAVTFDRLNQPKREISFYKVGTGFSRVFLSIITNGYTRILRFDNTPPPRPTLVGHQLRMEEEKKQE